MLPIWKGLETTSRLFSEDAGCGQLAKNLKRSGKRPTDD